MDFSRLERDMTVELEAVVIGAGVVGLACARQLAINGYETYVLEKASTFGTETSARNSQVIHAGLYYPTNSLKARLCVEGRRLLYDYCDLRNIKYKKIGKWVVASKSQEEILQKIYHQALDNGCHEVSFIEKSEALEIEPLLIADLILNSPETGILDVHDLMTALLADLEQNMGQVIFNSEVSSWEVNNHGVCLRLADADKTVIQAKHVINSAGLHAVPLLHKLVGFPKDKIPSHWYAKGNYFSLTGSSPFSRLVYPLPCQDGLGTHFTLDLNMQGKFGPDVEVTTELDYAVNDSRAQFFIKEIERYAQGIDIHSLRPDYAGIRPKIGTLGEFSDFLIQDQKDHNVRGLINLLGIESPGITAALAIAKNVIQLLNI